ncbi:MAG: protoporphyrinogen oxidase [Verrucomicrobia bacterium]|nr:protoporphyrinogen oxidase [Verrucomicrobiota bacterium]
MKSKRVIILGGGISGLSLAYFLKRNSPIGDITVVEKSSRAGGVFGTDISTGFFFERGPCLFKSDGHSGLSQLFKMLELDKKAAVAEPPYLKRYFSWKGKMQQVSLFSLDVWSHFFKEINAPVHTADESIYDFASRRFSPAIAEKYFEPMVCGYNGGDLKKLSINSYLPELKAAEQQHGSILLTYLRQSFKRKSPQWNQTEWLYFPEGSQAVIQALVDALAGHIRTNCAVEKIDYRDGKYFVETSQGVLEGDILCSALPAPVIGKLWVPELLSIPVGGLTSVCLGYRKKVLPKRGFGFFFPPKNEEGALLARFDSLVMPLQNQHKEETRIAVRLRHSDADKEKAIELAVRALKNHLKINDVPHRGEATIFEHGRPLMEVGHEPRIRALESMLAARFPNFYLVGNYFEGTLAHFCVSRSQTVARNITNKLASSLIPSPS